MIKHARLAPSAADRWSSCPGSVALCEGLEELPSSAAGKGTTLHNVAAKMLTTGKVQVTQAEIEALRLDKRDVASINTYLKTVWAETHDDATDIRVEQWFSLADMIHEDCGGTTDAAVYRFKNKHLTVFDYKSGIVPVDIETDGEEDEEPTANLQLSCYALGAYAAMSAEGLEIDSVSLCIVQPNGFYGDEIKRIELDPLDLGALAMTLREAAAATDDPNAPLVMGDHCRYCPANKAGRCPALNTLAANCANAEPPRPYGAMGIVESLETADKLQAWISAVRANAQMAASKGIVPPGYIYAESFGHRAWAVDDETAAVVLTQLDPEAKVFELVSPAQAEKAIGKKAFKSVADMLVSKPSRGFTLKRDNGQKHVDPMAVEFGDVSET